MKIAYKRKSKFDLDQTLKNIKKELETSEIEVLDDVILKSDLGYVVYFAQKELLTKLAKESAQLVSFLPSSFVIMENEGVVEVSVAQADLVIALTRDEDLLKSVDEYFETLKNIMHKSLGIKDLKISSVKLYSTQTCPYCTMEKQWLDENNIEHEVVYVDSDREAAENMVNRTGQRGVPVTEVSYDEGESEFIVGFDTGRLQQLLNIK